MLDCDWRGGGSPDEQRGERREEEQRDEGADHVNGASVMVMTMTSPASCSGLSCMAQDPTPRATTVLAAASSTDSVITPSPRATDVPLDPQSTASASSGPDWSEISVVTPTTSAPTTTAATTPATIQPENAGDGFPFGWVPVVAASVIALAVLVAVAIYLLRRFASPDHRGGPPSRSSGPPPSSSVPPFGVSPSSAAPPPRQAPGPRSVEELITAHDVAADDAERAAVEAELAGHGVERVMAQAGDPIDPAIHNVVQVEQSSASYSSPAVTRVVRPGWKGPTGLIRPADVTGALPPPDAGSADFGTG